MCINLGKDLDMNIMMIMLLKNVCMCVLRPSPESHVRVQGVTVEMRADAEFGRPCRHWQDRLKAEGKIREIHDSRFATLRS